MKLKVIKEHIYEEKNPLQLKKGEIVGLGRSSTEEDGWTKWVHCSKSNNSQQGWVPEQLIENHGAIGLILEDYTAKELNVEVEELLEGHYEINGWIWCTREETLDSGWVPKINLLKKIY